MKSALSFPYTCARYDRGHFQKPALSSAVFTVPSARTLQYHSPFFVIYQMLLDILPTARCFLKSHFIIEMLIKINVPHHVFGLHPPMAIPVCGAFVGESLVNHAALGRQSFIGCGRNVLHQRFHFLQQRFISQD